jgi:endonuclease/exonuclease/phosphatase family metal-dependent hydrolase
MPLALRRWRTSALLLLPIAALAGCLRLDTAGTPAAAGDYLFCFWNTENFFDGKVNGWKTEPDKEFDTWFGEHPHVFAEKVKKLTEVLAPLNDGKGPDILALAEVESDSEAAETLLASLNKAIKPGAAPYKHVLKKSLHGGRNIVTAILTRLPVVADRTQLLGRRQRILEGHIEVAGQDLAVLATHWTSRVSDEKGEGRDKYADVIYGRFRAMYEANPNISLLVCGDFNDNPDDPSVREHLHAIADRNKVKRGGEPPLLFDLFAPLWEENPGKVGSHFYRGHAYIFDHLVVSPGMVNGKGGWQCRPDTARIITHHVMDKKGHPYRFGTEKDKTPLEARGPSDHLPVTVQLTVVK